MPLRRKRLSEEEERAILLRRGELAALSQHPAWEIMQVEFGAERDRILRLLAAAISRGEPLTPERQAFVHGFMEGARFVLTRPGRAEAQLERHLNITEEAAA